MTAGNSHVRFEYDPGTIQYGPNVVAELATELERLGLERALVVCGRTVGSTPDVIEPVKEGLGDRLADVFAETTPQKLLDTAYAAVEAMEAANADVLVSLGGGSSLDTAKVASVLAATDKSRETVTRELVDRGGISVSDGPVPPIVAIPTTLAGADLSTVAGVNLSPENTEVVDEPTSGGVAGGRLMPAALFYDPELFATTPDRVLAASAMNGFDKGIETLYANNATPVTDATAVRGLRLLQHGLPKLGRGDRDADTLEAVVTGIILVQYGISRPNESTLSIIHAFGHALTHYYDIQQGAAHAIVAPHVLRYLFERVDARRELLAEAFEIDGEEHGPDDIVTAVAAVRDALDLPSQLRTVEGVEQDDLPAVAEYVLADGIMRNAPTDLDPTVEEITALLRDAW